MTNINQTSIIKFDGRYLSYTDINGNLTKIPAISGNTSNQNANLQNQKNLGPLPEGLYNLKQNDYENIDRIFDNIIGIVSFGKIGKWPLGEIAWGTERIWLQPQNSTETYGRNNFSIHGGIQAGSSGCIDLVGNAAIFFDFFKSLGQDAVLQVDYGSGEERYDGSDNPLLNNITDLTIENIYLNQGLDLQKLNSLKEFTGIVKTAVETQMQQSLSDQEFFNLLKGQNYNLVSALELNSKFADKYQLDFNLNQIVSDFFNTQFNGANYLLIKDLQNVSQLEKLQHLNSFFGSSFLDLNYDLNLIADQINNSGHTPDDLINDISDLFNIHNTDFVQNAFNNFFVDRFFEDYQLNPSYFDVNLELNKEAYFTGYETIISEEGLMDLS